MVDAALAPVVTGPPIGRLERFDGEGAPVEVVHDEVVRRRDRACRGSRAVLRFR